MPDFETMTEFTCGTLLSATHLKAICRYRGFAGDGKKNKAALTSFVAPRLVGANGVRDAMASLETKWLAVLHRIAISSGNVTVRDLFPIVFPDKKFYMMPTQNFFKHIADELLSRGVVFVEDRPSATSYSKSRYEKLVFHVLPEHRRLLPDYPVSTQSMSAPLSSNSPAADFESFFRDLLKAALSPKSAKKLEDQNNIVSLFAVDFSVSGGEIQYRNKKIKDITTCYQKILDDWTDGRGIKNGKKYNPRAFTAIRHILGHLRPGQGVHAGALHSALAALKIFAGEEGIAQFCEFGYKIGILQKSVSGGTQIYRAYGESGGLPEFKEEELVFKTDDTGIIVDIGRSSIVRLLVLASLCHAQPKKGALHLSPSIPLMGAAAEVLEDYAAIKQVRRVSKAFDVAVRDVRNRQNSLLVHQGLQVLRVADLGLRTVLLHRFSEEIRPLEGPYLVAVRAAMPAIEKIIRSEGFSPRLER